MIIYEDEENTFRCGHLTSDLLVYTINHLLRIVSNWTEYFICIEKGEQFTCLIVMKLVEWRAPQHLLIRGTDKPLELSTCARRYSSWEFSDWKLIAGVRGHV